MVSVSGRIVLGQRPITLAAPCDGGAGGQEAAWFETHCVGSAKTSAHLCTSRTRLVLDAMRALDRRLQDADRRIARYDTFDPVPSVGATGRPIVTLLEDVEAALATAGFTTAEIATLVPDARTKSGGDERRKHRKRVQKRVARGQARHAEREAQQVPITPEPQAAIDRARSPAGMLGRKKRQKSD